MAGLINLIGKIFGNKYDKDVKEITPIINQINQEFETLKSISNNDLREKTNNFRKNIKDSIKKEVDQISVLKDKASDS